MPKYRGLRCLRNPSHGWTGTASATTVIVVAAVATKERGIGHDSIPYHIERSGDELCHSASDCAGECGII